MNVKAIALLVLAALLLSGCASKKGDGDGDGTGTGTSTKTATTSGTKTTSGTGSQTGSMGTTTVNFTRATPNAEVPLAVNFTLDATFKGGDGKEATPASLSWSVAIRTGNGTNATNATTTAGPAGTSLPANFTLNFTTAGNHTVVATVTATGFAPGNASILVMAAPGGAGAPLFFDGAEGDASQFTLQSRVFVNPNAQGTTGQREVAQNHPDGPWVQEDGGRTGTKAWGHPYPDNYRTRMTTVGIEVPAGGATLSYALKGGAEDTSVEGLFVLVALDGAAGEVKAHHTNVIADWTVFTVPLAAGTNTVEFRFDTDLSCSDDSDAPPGFSCGDGYDAGGFQLDDITVA